MPSGACITSTNPEPPAGFSFSGNTILSAGSPLWTSIADIQNTSSFLYPKYTISTDTAIFIFNSQYIYKYYPSTGNFSASVSTSFTSPGVVEFGGYFYFFGGTTTPNAVKEYDPITNVWTTKSSMPTGRVEFAITKSDSLIYIIGGNNNGTILKNVEAYNPLTDTWDTLADLPVSNWQMGAAIKGSHLITFGGNDHETAIYRYDINLNIWEYYGKTPSEIREPVQIINGEDVYFLQFDNYERIYKFNLISEGWSFFGSQPDDGSIGTGAIQNGKLYVFGCGTIAPKTKSYYCSVSSSLYLHCKE